MWSSDVELFDHFSVYLASHGPLQQFIEKIIEFVKEINSHAKSPGAWEPGSQRPQHLKQPKHLRVARRPAA